MRMSSFIRQVASGAIPLGVALPGTIEVALRGIIFGLGYGASSLFTGLIAGVLFGIIGWLADVMNTSDNRVVAAYGTLGLAIVFATAVVAAAAFAPPAFLARLS